MEFNRDELEQLVSKKLAVAERSVVRAYLKGCCGEEETDEAEIDNAVEEFISSRAEHGAAALSEQLEQSNAANSELERRLAETSFELAVSKAIYSMGVKSEYCEDVRLLASHSLDVQSSGEDIANAVASVVERIPAFADSSDAASVTRPDFAGHKGNFPRKDDSAALMQNRLDSARASGDNSLSVAIISEAAEMGISLR